MHRQWPQIARRRLDPTARYGLSLTLFIVAVILVGIPFSYLLIEITSDDEVVRMDMAAAEWLFELMQQAPAMTTVFNGISLLGAPVWLWPLVGGVCVYLWTPRLSLFRKAGAFPPATR